MYNITVMPENKTFFYEPGKSLLTLLREEGIFVESPCGGAGTCGKCRVILLSGERSLPRREEEQEKKAQEEKEQKEGAARDCLACRIFPSGDLTVEISKRQKDELPLAPHFSFSTEPMTEPMGAQPGRARSEKTARTSIARTSLGLAVDIGTTTLEATLADRETGEELAARSALNPQTRYGMDVLSRISHVMAHPEGVREMQGLLTEKLNAMAEDLCREARVSSFSIDMAAVAANSTMLHLLLGISPAPLGVFPFTPAFLESREMPAREVGLTALGEHARLVCLPSVSAFIGADIVAGVRAAGLAREKGNVLFIDIGTNGEIVLSRQGSLVSCSCAAGPALEGMNIGCGMRAEPGAIEDVSIDPQGVVRLRVIDGEVPVGICGSGILAAIRELLRSGLLRRDGSLLTETEVKEELPPARWGLAALCREENGVPAVSLWEDIVVTQKDVRQAQLAKGALLSGSLALLNWAGLPVEDIDKILVAGQFGAHLPVESLTGCGILPQGPSLATGKVKYVGNASKSGALMVLTSPSTLAEMDDLAHNIAYVELGATPGYQELFMECLEFPA